jgi:NAD(P)-dependent dehydrogenase (short-subunit alcohol dehydrogenase family)
VPEHPLNCLDVGAGLDRQRGCGVPQLVRGDPGSPIAALHRVGAPGEVSPAVVFLASPAAAMVTGHTLVVDGGWWLT